MRGRHVITVCAAVAAVAGGAGLAAAGGAVDAAEAAPAPAPSAPAPSAPASSAPAPATESQAPVVCGDVPVPAWVPEEVDSQPRVTCGDADPLHQDEWLTGRLGGTGEVPPPPVLPVGVDEVAYDLGWIRPDGEIGPGLHLTMYEDTDELADEALPGARQVELAGGVPARLTTTDNGLGATRVEWVTAGHSYLLLGSRVITPEGEEAGPVVEDLLRMAASTL